MYPFHRGIKGENKIRFVELVGVDWPVKFLVGPMPCGATGGQVHSEPNDPIVVDAMEGPFSSDTGFSGYGSGCKLESTPGVTFVIVQVQAKWLHQHYHPFGCLIIHHL